MKITKKVRAARQTRNAEPVQASEDYIVDFDLAKLDKEWWEAEERRRLDRELADEEDFYDLEHGEGQYADDIDSCDQVQASSTRDRISNLEQSISEMEYKIAKMQAAGVDPDEIIDYQLTLDELKDELNFAWQDDEAEYNYALEQQEFNPDGSLRGYSDYEDTYASTSITAARILPNKQIQVGLEWNRDWHRFLVQSISGDRKTCKITEDWLSEDTGEPVHKEYLYNIEDDGEHGEYVWEDKYKKYAKPGQDDYSWWARMYATGADNYPWQDQLALDEAAEGSNEDDESIPGMHYILYNVYNGETVGSWDTVEEARDARDDYGWSSSDWHVVETDWDNF